MNDEPRTKKGRANEETADSEVYSFSFYYFLLKDLSALNKDTLSNLELSDVMINNRENIIQVFLDLIAYQKSLFANIWLSQNSEYQVIFLIQR